MRWNDVYGAARAHHLVSMYSYISLSAWKLAHQLTIDVLRATDEFKSPRTWAVFDQLRRAVVSVEVNIVEGYALHTNALLARHLRIAIGSLAEVECLIQTSREMEYLPADEARRISGMVDETFPPLVGLYCSCHRRQREN